MGKTRVTIDGVGVVKVKHPKKLTSETLGDAIADAVGQTMNLVAAPSGFHPALGYKRE